MACPFFDPVRPRTSFISIATAVLPLGDDYAGICRAVAGEACEPSESILRPLCNMGYARGSCARFPADPACPDAVRFTIARDSPASLDVYYVLERDHHPHAHGSLAWSPEQVAFHPPPENPVLAHQARAYLESYQRRKKEASCP